MTQFFKTVFYLACSILLISCGNDDDLTSPPVSPPAVVEPGTGSFSVDGVPIDLTQGFYYPDEFISSTNLYVTIIVIADGGYAPRPDRRLSGAATSVFIRLYSDMSNVGLVGDYEITDDSTVAGQAEVYVAVNYDINNDTLDEDADLESGSLSITKAADGTYDVSIENGLTDFSARTFVMTYDGAIVRL
jgi:hypothetical protein